MLPRRLSLALICVTGVAAEEIASGESSLPMPGRRSVRVGMAEITYKLDRDGAQRALGRLAREGGCVRVAEQPVGVMIDVPVIKQAYRSNNETAALQMLLASRGVDRDQRELQRLLRRDGPLRPRTREDGAIVWENPEWGFVGLSGLAPELIFARLLSGHAVLAWVGPSAGPYRSWIGPRGERVTVNWGEQAVLLVGLAGSRILLNDPRTGERQNWSRQQFKRRWGLLGRRALSV